MELEINDKIVKTALVGIVAVDQDGNIISINESAISILSNEPLSADELIGRSYLDVFLKGNKFTHTGQYTSALIETLETGEPCLQKELSYRNKTLLVDSSPLIDDKRKVVGAISIFRDITDKRILEERLRQAEKFAAIGQLSAGLAHELLNPLTVIKGFLQLYEKGDMQGTESWRILLDEVNKVSRLVNDFLLLTNPSAPKYQSISLQDLLVDVANEFASVAEHKQIQVHLDIETNFPDIMADLHQIRQVMVNLLMNAFDCLSPGGEIRIRSIRDNETIILSVFNNGPVIPNDIRPRIFDPFFTTKDHGQGLGLAISYRIVENHRGHMFVESLEGKGTTFTIQLPIR
ncbi:ATP-binding protein [Effusibacillus consociatus]|uniref:histidine kinase n=1 Tax=Effusibacillus consociatus TaxID=1117041 RepID=A0ABV9Q3B1_9BACL